jgi:hypothetical protein
MPSNLALLQHLGHVAEDGRLLTPLPHVLTLKPLTVEGGGAAGGTGGPSGSGSTPKLAGMRQKPGTAAWGDPTVITHIPAAPEQDEARYSVSAEDPTLKREVQRVFVTVW